NDPDGSIASTSIDFGDGTVVTGSSASHTYSQVATYTVRAIITDNAGASMTASQQVTVTPGVTVYSPVAGATLGVPVHFVAQAVAASPITAMKIYLDSRSIYSVSAAQIDAYSGMSKGTHNVTVQAWDSNGAVYKNSFPLTVR